MKTILPFPLKPLVLTLGLLANPTFAAQQFELTHAGLADNLQQLAEQAGITLSFSPSLVNQQVSQKFSGQFEIADLLNRLLEQHSLVAVQKSENTWVISAQTSNIVALEKSTIYANQLGTITEHTGSYTPGTIATATRLTLTPRETPQSISVITRQEMDDFNLTNIESVIKRTPGVSTVVYDSERTTFFARGFAINNFQYDGIPMVRDGSYSAGNTLSDMAIYDRVEVLKGSNGLLNGNGEPGATINLVRKKPTIDPQGHLLLGAGSWDTYRSELDVSGALTDSGNIRGRFVTAYQKKHSFQNSYERETQVHYGVLEFDLADSTLLTIGADFQDNSPKGSSWGGIAVLDDDGNFNKVKYSYNNAPKWSKWDQYTRSAFATLEHTFANGWTGKLQATHQINGYKAELGSLSRLETPNAKGDTLYIGGGRYIGRTRTNAVDMYLSGFAEIFGREHEFVLGNSFSRRHWGNKGYSLSQAYSENNTYPNYDSWDNKPPKPEWQYGWGNNTITREQGYYATGRLNLMDDLKLIIGGRISYYKSPTTRVNDQFTPYAGIIYDLNKNFSVYASYSNIFKAQEWAKDAQGKSLDPEEGTNYEIGVKASFYDGRLNAQAAYFEVKQDNLATETRELGINGDYAYRAAQGVKTKGYELEMSGALTDHWQIQTGFSHKIAREKSIKYSTVEPENQFTLNTTYQLSGMLSPITVGGGLRWQSRTWGSVYNTKGDIQKEVGQKAYWLVDAMASYQVTDDLSVTLNVDNLLNKRYFTLMDFYSSYSWATPRSVSLSTRWSF